MTGAFVKVVLRSANSRRPRAVQFPAQVTFCGLSVPERRPA
ncbi:hypothetical protein [Lysobacter gummosus]